MRILLIVSGGIAAYKALELIRLLKKDGASLNCVLTAGGARFITPLSVSALSGAPCHTDLWSLKDEAEMGHIRLSREADLVLVAPASANLIAKMAHGLADDLASAALLASDKPVMFAPAMNPAMWSHPAVQANVSLLEQRGNVRIGPAAGDMACGETGEGRMAEPADIAAAVRAFRDNGRGRPLAGRKALVTSGPTLEPLDPVRYIGNRSSGRQGHAIAAALRKAGANVTLVSGPVALPDPPGVNVVRVETASEMLAACRAALPADIAVCAAAVADWAPEDGPSASKIKKGAAAPVLKLKQNPDILAALAQPGEARPVLVAGFAAETGDPGPEAARKRLAKNCDFILGNDVTQGVFGGTHNHVVLAAAAGLEDWGRLTKDEVAERLAERLAQALPYG